jgi:hypothetical protein
MCTRGRGQTAVLKRWGCRGSGIEGYVLHDVGAAGTLLGLRPNARVAQKIIQLHKDSVAIKKQWS